MLTLTVCEMLDLLKKDNLTSFNINYNQTKTCDDVYFKSVYLEKTLVNYFIELDTFFLNYINVIKE